MNHKIKKGGKKNQLKKWTKKKSLSVGRKKQPKKTSKKSSAYWDKRK